MTMGPYHATGSWSGWPETKGPLHAMAVLLLILVSPISARAQEWKEPLLTRGVTPTVVYGGSVFSDLAGGIERGRTYSGNLDLQLALDGERLVLPDTALEALGRGARIVLDSSKRD
jgi:hypothetical protein